MPPHAATDRPLIGLTDSPAPPGQSGAGVRRFPALGGTIDPLHFVGWLQSAVGVLQNAAGTSDYLDRAARATATIAGLDSAQILLGHGDDFPVSSEDATRPDPAVVGRVRSERRTFWCPVRAVVAAPILGSGGEFGGILYGERRTDVNRPPLTELEARLVELLAGAVAAGLARLDEERRTVAEPGAVRGVLPPELARHLLETPGLLDGRSFEVTILFADIRGYSARQRAARPGRDGQVGRRRARRDVRLCPGRGRGARRLHRRRADGDVGRAGEQPDHAARAGRAARAMLARVPAVGDRWSTTTGQRLALGFGVHTGPAHVGNVGTKHKFKYGPLGPTNNLASRVQGATKFLRVPILVTGATRAPAWRRLRDPPADASGVVNIAEPVDLVEVAAEPPPGWLELRDGYERRRRLRGRQASRRHPTARPAVGFPPERRAVAAASDASGSRVAAECAAIRPGMGAARKMTQLSNGLPVKGTFCASK